MPQRRGRIASRSLGKQEQPRTQIRGESLPRPQVSASSPWLRLAGSALRASRLANAFVRWNALECARDGHKSGHTLNRGRISGSTTCWKQWWAGTGLNRRHQDFQSYSPVCVSARNCLMWNTRLPTASCARVRWNDQECAGVGHNLGTNRVPLLLDDFIRPPEHRGEIVRLRAWLAHRPASRQASTSDQSQIANKTSKTTGAAPAWASAVGSVG